MARRADGSFRHATEIAASNSDEIDAGWDEAPTQITFPPASGARKVSGVRQLSASLPPVVTAPRPNPSGRVPRALTPPLSWLDRAALLQEQLGIGDRASPSVRAKPAPVRQEPALVREEPARHEPAPEEPTLAREEPTLVREEPTLIREEPTLVLEERTLEFSTASLAVATFSVSEVALDEAGRNVDAEVAEQVRDDELFGEESGERLRETTAVPSETQQSSEFEIPNFRRHQVGPALIVAAMAVAAALIVASVVSHQFTNHPVTSAEVSAPEVSKEAPQQLPADPEPAALSTPKANTAIDGAAAPQAAPPSTSPETAPAAVVVTVRRKHAARPRPATTPVSDSPFEGASENSNGAAPEPSPAAPAPESAPTAAPSSEPPAGAAPVE